MSQKFIVFSHRDSMTEYFGKGGRELYCEESGETKVCDGKDTVAHFIAERESEFPKTTFYHLVLSDWADTVERIELMNNEWSHTCGIDSISAELNGELRTLVDQKKEAITAQKAAIALKEKEEKAAKEAALLKAKEEERATSELKKLEELLKKYPDAARAAIEAEQRKPTKGEVGVSQPRLWNGGPVQA